MARGLYASWINTSEQGVVTAQQLIDDTLLQIGDGYRAKNAELGQTGLPFLRAANLSGGVDLAGAEILSYSSVEKAEGKVSRAGDVAFTSKGTVGRFARVDERHQPFVYSPQICFWRSIDPARLHPAILYCMMRTPSFESQLTVAAGQTDMAPYVSLTDQRRITMPMLPPNQYEVGQNIETFLSRQALLDEESRTLATLRDALLPKLFSRELPIADAEKRIAVA
jgi:type I restriction enzyme S subunit